MNRIAVDLLKQPLSITFAYFVIAAILGLSMRLAFVTDMPSWFEYRNIQHAHSHVALLGWLFAVYYIMIIQVFELDWAQYSKLYVGLQVCVLGMLLTFPFIGYASFSIVFSTVHILLSYIFVFKVWREITLSKHGLLPILFLKASLVFLALSTLGTWALGPIMALGLKGSAIYYGAIQFYLHFQFNGWFIFALLAVIFALLQSNSIVVPKKDGLLFFWILTFGTIMTYALAVTWSTPHIGIFMINSLGVLLQLYALILFYNIIRRIKVSFAKILNRYAFSVIKIALFVLFLKIVVQTAVVIPSMAEVSYTIRNFVIAFIHLLMLGGLSLFAFSITSQKLGRPLSLPGTIIFIFGVVITEILLFGQGLMQWQGWGFMSVYYELIFGASLLILIGIIFIFTNLTRTKR